MKISIGAPVTGEDFFDREQEQEQIWRKLERNHIMLLAPRRIGKTSLMHRLCETAETHGFQSAITSFAPCEDEMGCVREIIKAVSKKQRSGEKFIEMFNKALGHVKGIKLSAFGVGGGIDLQAENNADWREVGEALTAALDELEGMQLICVDELPVFVLKLLGGENGREQARNFLYWFRDLRQKYRQARWILAGSIGMDTVASRYRLGDTVNDLDPFPLGAFSEATADAFLARLAGSYDMQLSTEIRQYMIERVGWPVPYYLQLLFDKLIGPDRCPDRAMIDSAFEELLSPAYKVHFDYWRQRLQDELGSPDDGHAVRLLNAICRDHNGAGRSLLSQVLQERIQEPEQREETLRYLLDVLESDGYLVQTGDRFKFRLEWLREYWLRRVA